MLIFPSHGDNNEREKLSLPNHAQAFTMKTSQEKNERREDDAKGFALDVLLKEFHSRLFVPLIR